MDFEIGRGWRIPVVPGQAVSRGWTALTGHRPAAVTWHWTATRSLARCNELLGGSQAVHRGRASAHLAIGRSFAEGVESYVSLDHRSWHAGHRQTLRWDGRPLRGDDEKGARTTIGVETVNLGYARPAAAGELSGTEEGAAVTAGDDWIVADTVGGGRRLRVQPWSEPQIEMMIEVGKHIVARWPHLGPRDHHGHHDLCPGYKVDVAGFPFARVLRGIYDEPGLPDVWTPVWTAAGRRRALRRLGYRAWNAVRDDPWTRADDLALRRCQQDLGLWPDGLWTTAVSWAVHDASAGGLP